MTAVREPAARRPPVVVFAGSYLFGGVAALALVGAIGAFFAIPELSLYESERAGDDSAGQAAGSSLVLLAALAIVFSGLCLALAILNGHGRHGARVLTWVLGGLTVCFNITLLIIGPYDSVPWYQSLTRTVAVATIVLAAGSTTLLALPASHGYFRGTRAARQQRRFRLEPPLGYRPPNHLTPPPGYQPPPLSSFQVPPPGYRPPGSLGPAIPAYPVAPLPVTLDASSPPVGQTPPNTDGEATAPPTTAR